MNAICAPIRPIPCGIMLKLDPAKTSGDGKRTLEIDYKSTEHFLDEAIDDYMS